MKLLNKIPVLDKGYVAVHSSLITHEEYMRALKLCYRDMLDLRMLSMVSILIKVKCPLFVQLSIAEHDLHYVTERTSEVEAYIPSIVDIDAGNIETSIAIHKDIEETSAALLINSKAYQADNCNTFVSQVISPISIYNTLLVYGSLASWMRYIEQKGLPKPIEQYRSAIEDALSGEWNKVIQEWRARNNAKKKK